jgi:hypothetical protein
VTGARLRLARGAPFRLRARLVLELHLALALGK